MPARLLVPGDSEHVKHHPHRHRLRDLADPFTFARVPLLVIDDFGLKPLRAPQDEDFHDLVAERHEQGATITSNLDFSEWGDAFTNRLLGAATLDRLRHGAYRLTLEGESYRSPRPMPGPRKSTVATGGKSKK